MSKKWRGVVTSITREKDKRRRIHRTKRGIGRRRTKDGTVAGGKKRQKEKRNQRKRGRRNRSWKRRKIIDADTATRRLNLDQEPA